MRPLARAVMLAALAPCASAADKLPDSDLLEFLGSVDAEGAGWSEYLERTNLDRMPKPAVPKKPATTTPPAPKPAKAAPPPPAANQPEAVK